MPFPKDPKMQIQQDWTSTHDPQHHGIDYIKGDVDNAATWQSFPVLAAATGLACANPPSREGNAVLLMHNIFANTNIGSTYYGHLDKIEKDIPQCDDKVPPKLKKQGKKLGDAGSTDARAQALIHLHFQVNDANGNPIDPYDLKGERYVYPKPDFSDVEHKPCGPNALLIDCYPKDKEVNVTVDKPGGADWKQFSSKDLKYNAQFPSNFTRQTIKLENGGGKADVLEGKYEESNVRLVIMSFDKGLQNPAELLELQSALLLNIGLGQLMGTFPDTETLDSIPINIGGLIQGEAEVVLIMNPKGKPALTLIDTLIFTQKRSWFLAMTTDATESSARQKMENLFQKITKTFLIK